jgi:RimJ/RimL family protein N-acetyltransferase
MRPTDGLLLHRLMNEPAVMEALGERPTRLAFWQDCLRLWCVDPHEANYAVLDGDAGTPIGWLGLHGPLAADRTASLKMLALLPPYWGQGFARAAMALAVPWLRADSHERLRVEVLASNARGLAFFEGQGFEVVGSGRRRAGTQGAPQTTRVLERPL